MFAGATADIHNEVAMQQDPAKRVQVRARASAFLELTGRSRRIGS